MKQNNKFSRFKVRKRIKCQPLCSSCCRERKRFPWVRNSTRITKCFSFLFGPVKFPSSFSVLFFFFLLLILILLPPPPHTTHYTQYVVLCTLCSQYNCSNSPKLIIPRTTSRAGSEVKASCASNDDAVTCAFKPKKKQKRKKKGFKIEGKPHNFNNSI